MGRAELEGARDLGRVVVRHADLVDQTLRLELVRGTQAFLERVIRVRLVQIELVDGLHAERFERCRELRADTRGAQTVGLRWMRLRPHA